MMTSENLDPEKMEARRQTVRAWKLAAGVVVLVIAILAGVLRYYDVPPPDETDMLPAPEDDAVSNPLETFMAVLGSHPFGTISHESVNRLPDDEARHAFLQLHQPALEALETLLSTDRKTWRWPNEFTGAVKDDDFKNATLALAMGQIIRVKVQMESFKSQEQAIQSSLSLIKFGNGLSGAKGTLIHYLVSITLQRIGESCLEEPLTSHPTPPEALAGLLKQLTEQEPSLEDYSTTLRTEYAYGNRITAAYIRGEKVPTNPEFDIGGYPPPVDRWLFKPNMSARLRLAAGRSVITGLAAGWKQALEAQTQGNVEINDFCASPLRLWINPNTTGILSQRMNSNIHGKILEKATQSAALNRQIVLQLALRYHELVHGALPPRLDEMIPGSLPFIPADPFDDLPMKWDATRKTVYSVGSNLKDDDGDFEKSAAVQEMDLGMYYWWSEKAAEARDKKNAKPVRKKRLTAPIGYDGSTSPESNSTPKP